MSLSNILDWVKKHVWQTVLIVFGLFFLPLILVHIAYRIQAISPWFTSAWEAGELITYIAGFEAFLGTVFLGIIAAQQNEKATKLNERMLTNEENRDSFERQPCLMIFGWTLEDKICKDCYSDSIKYVCGDIDKFTDDAMVKQVTIKFINSSMVLTECHLHSVKFSMKDGSKSTIDCLDSSINPVSFYQHYLPHGEMDVVLLFRQSDLQFLRQAAHAEIELMLTNSIGEKFREFASFVPVLSVDPFFFTLVNPEYQVYKISKDAWNVTNYKVIG